MITGTLDIIPNEAGRITQGSVLRLDCDTSTAPVIINLPPIADLKAYRNVKIIVFDGAKNASANNITINGSGSESLGSDEKEVITVNGGGVTIGVASLTEWLSTDSSEMTGAGSGGVEWYDVSIELPIDIGDKKDEIYNPEKIITSGSFYLNGSPSPETPASIFPNLTYLSCDTATVDLTFSPIDLVDIFPTPFTFIGISLEVQASTEQSIILKIKELIGTLLFQGSEDTISVSLPDLISSKAGSVLGNPVGQSGIFFEDYEALASIETPNFTTLESTDESILSAFVAGGIFPVLTSLEWYEYLINNVEILTTNTLIVAGAAFTGNTAIDNTEIQRFFDSIAPNLALNKVVGFGEMTNATSLTVSSDNNVIGGLIIYNCANLTTLDISDLNETWLDQSLGDLGINIYDNVQLSSLTVSLGIKTKSFGASNCALPEANIDAILASIDAGGESDGNCDLDGGTNAAPSAAGLLSKTSLESKGWSVAVN